MAEHRATCQCGALAVSASADPDAVVACNCVQCQKRTGAPFGVGGYFRKDVLTITGTASTWGRVAPTGRALVNHFCPTCGTALYWTLEMRPDHIGVALGAFDTPPLVPERAIWTTEKHGWVEFPADMPAYDHGTPGV